MGQVAQSSSSFPAPNTSHRGVVGIATSSVGHQQVVGSFLCPMLRAQELGDGFRDAIAVGDAKSVADSQIIIPGPFNCAAAGSGTLLTLETPHHFLCFSYC